MTRASSSSPATFLVTVVLWLFGKRGNLRRVATALLPFVITADLGNNRRGAWMMLPAMLLALSLVAYVRSPARRTVIGAWWGVLLLVSTGYVLVFRNSTSVVAEPAHAIWSQFQPDTRHASSNLNRHRECQPGNRHPHRGLHGHRLRGANCPPDPAVRCQQHRPAHQLHPPQQHPVRMAAHGHVGSYRVLVHDRRHDRGQLPACPTHRPRPAAHRLAANEADTPATSSVTPARVPVVAYLYRRPVPEPGRARRSLTGSQ